MGTIKTKSILVLVLLLALGSVYKVSAQTTEAEGKLKKVKSDTLTGWRKGGVFNVNLSQVALNNWAAGGENSVSINGLVSLFANYYDTSSNTSWDNSLEVGYGVLKQGESDWIKTDDKIDFTSKYGRKATKSWYYSGLVNFRTQMAPGFNLPNDSVRISALFAPAYLLGAIGMDYKPNGEFSAFISPITGKFTFVLDEDLADAGAFGVEAAELNDLGEVITPGKQFRAEIGGYLKLMYKKDVMKNVTFQTKVDVFSNYLNNPQNLDVNWEALISMKVNEYLTASITTHLIYDDDINLSIDNDGDGVIDEVGPRTQFKEVLAIGFSYKF